MKNIVFISLLLLLYGCRKEDYQISNINGNRIDIMGHGGMGIDSDYPMNSVESILASLSLGATGTELDVQMTKDSVLVAFHDYDLSENTSMEGKVSEYTWEELNEAYYTKGAFSSYRITRLDDIFGMIDDAKKYKFTFDCKVYAAQQEMSVFCNVFALQLADFIESHQLIDRVMIEASSLELINSIQLIDPLLRILYYPGNYEDGIAKAKELNLFGITISSLKITQEQILAAHEEGFFVAIWQIRSRSMNREAIRKNPDMIQSDKLKHLIRELR